MARMRILTANEQQAFDKPPLFDHRDRKKYFDLAKGLMDIAKKRRENGRTKSPKIPERINQFRKPCGTLRTFVGTNPCWPPSLKVRRQSVYKSRGTSVAQHAGSGNGNSRMGRLVQPQTAAWAYRKYPASRG